MEKIKDYFERYPVSQEVFENGGILFHSRGAADSYGTGETKRYTRQSVNSEQSTANSDPLVLKEVAITKLKATEDLNALDYQKLSKLSQDLGLKTVNNKKPTILEALTAEKERLNAE